MEAIQDLISTLRTSIKKLNNYLFINEQTKYIIITSMTSYMEEALEGIEDKIKGESITEEQVEKIKGNINTMLASVQDYLNLFRQDDNTIVSFDNGGNIVTTPQDIHVELEHKSYVDQVAPEAVNATQLKDYDLAKVIDQNEAQAIYNENRHI